ncbi:MAG: family 43 glycosylhydrolase [Bacteroidaceae bacterium]|nr:family 43 glycosylhydrolase [Bacteroidaceae bacterium]
MRHLHSVIKSMGVCAAAMVMSMTANAQDYTYKWTADKGDGTYVNPMINADFPDCDVIRVGDTFYFVSTTMYHFPGATLLKSKDLVNWEYCANPLEKIDSNNAYDLMGASHYSQGQWAASLNYHDGKFYIYFICYGRSGVDNTQNILLTATDPEGEWTMTKMNDHYYDSG